MTLWESMEGVRAEFIGGQILELTGLMQLSSGVPGSAGNKLSELTGLLHLPLDAPVALVTDLEGYRRSGNNQESTQECWWQP